MELKQVVLVLVDISGYTRFMKMHTMSLLHAEAIITELLETVIDNAEYPLTLSKLEGDAAFLYATLPEDKAQAASAAHGILQQVNAFFEAFNRKERELIACDTCRCEACNNISQLKLKAFLHTGEVVIKKIRQFEELAGEEVILIHRLLKNSVEAKEYVLMTQTFYELSGGLAGQEAETRVEEAEGLDDVTVRVYYRQADKQLPARPLPIPPVPGTEMGAFASRVHRYANDRILGRTEPTFNHLPPAKFSRLSFWSYYVGGTFRNMIAGIRYLLGNKNSGF